MTTATLPRSLNTKYCSDCEQTLPRTQFYKDCTRGDGLQGRCKACSKERSATYYIEHRRGPITA